MKSTITISILAGGKGRRLEGTDKGLMNINGKHSIEYILNTVRPVSDNIIISANRNLERYRSYGFQVIKDSMVDYQGPLAGILTALQTVDTDFILTIPCDCPLIHQDYLARMTDGIQEENMIVIAHDGERMQPLHALIPVALSADLQTYLNEGHRRVDRWYRKHQIRLIDFSDNPEQFYNANTEADIVQLTTLLQQR